MNYVTAFKALIDILVKSMNWFPGLKTKVGALLTVLGTLMMGYNQFGSALTGFHIPDEIVLSTLAAGQLLTAVGTANLMSNNKPTA